MLNCIVFDGFAGGVVRTVPVDTIEGGSVALFCDVLTGNPTPQIQWFADGIPLQENTVDDSLLFLNNGGYLYIRSLSAAQRAMMYHCEVTTFEGEIVRDPNTFSLSTDLLSPGIREYRSLGALAQFPMVRIGEPGRLVYSAAARDAAGARVDLELTCPSTLLMNLSVSNQFVVTATFLPAAAGMFEVFFECTISGGGFSNQVFGALQMAGI